MKKAYLLYTTHDAEINSGYIESFIKAAAKRNTELLLKTSDDDISFDIDFVINRSRDHIISKRFDDAGVPVFNNTEVTKVCNDKWLTYMRFKDKVPMAYTTQADEVFFPAVIKPVRGHGGKNISLANSKEEFEKAKKEALLYEDFALSGEKHEKGIIAQELIDTGRDMRVYILGGEILASVLRSSDENFKSNFSLGGSVSFAKITPEIKSIVDTVLSEMSFDLCGIDIVFDKGKPLLGEIEDAVGARMLYSLTDIDLPAMYLDYILKKI